MLRTTIFLFSLFLAACTQSGQGVHSASNYWILAEDPDTGQTYYVDETGQTAIPPGKYAMCLTDTFRTHAIVLLQGKNQWAAIDRQEEILYEIFLYDNGPDAPSEGLFRIVQNGKIGYADAATYAIIIQPQFDCAFPFENGNAKVSNNCQTINDGEHNIWTSEDWQYVDKTGNIYENDPTSQSNRK